VKSNTVKNEKDNSIVMKAKILSLLYLCFVLTGCGLRAARNEQGQSFGKPGNAYDKLFQIGTLLYYDDFTQQSKNWVAETAVPG